MVDAHRGTLDDDTLTGGAGPDTFFFGRGGGRSLCDAAGRTGRRRACVLGDAARRRGDDGLGDAGGCQAIGGEGGDMPGQRRVGERPAGERASSARAAASRRSAGTPDGVTMAGPVSRLVEKFEVERDIWREDLADWGRRALRMVGYEPPPNPGHYVHDETILAAQREADQIRADKAAASKAPVDEPAPAPVASPPPALTHL